MKRLLLIFAAIGIGLGVGFAVAVVTFENPPQQMALVRNVAIIAAVLGSLYFGLKKRPHPKGKGAEAPASDRDLPSKS